MKKLITMIGAVAMSFGLFAEAFTSSVNDDIQTRTLGDSNIVGSEESGAIHWWDDNFATTGYEQPAVVSNDTTLIENTKYLKVETDSSPLLRTFTPVTTGGDPATYSYGKVDIENHGLFIDTKVRMTGFESDPTPQGDGNKLLVWLKAVTDEDAGGAGYTNLMVTCGFWDGELVTPTNYVVTAAGLDVKPDEWVRLTIRADKDTDDNVAKFKVFVNEKQVTADVEGGELSVFPSLVGSKSTDLSLAAAGFQGNGGINSVGLLTAADAPDFAADPTILTITWNEGVTGFTVGERTIDVIGAGTTNLVIASDEIELGDIVVTPTFKTNPQYELNGFTLDGDPLAADKGAAKFLMTRYKDMTLAIEAKQSRVGATLFVDGHSLGDYAFVKEAVGALKNYGQFENATITLVQNETIDDFGNWASLEGNIILDLNGKAIAVDTEHEWKGSQEPSAKYMINNQGANITITNSVADWAQMIGSTDVWLINNNSTMNLADANIKYDGYIYSYCDDQDYFGELTIYGGKFKPKAEFADNYNGLAEGLDWGDEDADGFYPVVPKTAEPVAQIGDGRRFETLAEAFDAADDTDTVTLLANCELNTQYALTKNITLVLNGKTLSKDVTKSADGKNKMIIVQGGATLTVNGSVEGSTVKGGLYAGVSATSFGTIVANGGSYYPAEGKDDCAFQSNGNAQSGAGNTITITDATIYSANDIAVYLAGAGTYTITGCTIDAATGIYLKGGALTMTGTTITAKGEFLSALAADGNGAKSTGDGIVVDAKVGYAGNVSLNLGADNDVSSVNGYAVRDALSDKNETALSALTITDGKYVSGAEKPAVIVADATKTTVSITGGKFGPVAPAANLAPAGYEFALKEGFYELQAKTFNITYEFVDENDQPLVGVTNPYAETTTFKVTDENITFETDATLDGYTFSAWNPTGIICAETFTDVTVTGKFTKDAPAEITITLVKGADIADIKTNGTSVVGEVVKLPADATSIEIELVAASTIKIPVYKVSYAEVGGKVTSKKTTYTIVDGNTLTFSAEEASSSDPQVTEEAAKQAFKDLGETEAAKIEALTTGTDPIAAKAVATWINDKGLDPKTVLAGEFVKASVKLDTTVPITKGTSVQIDTLTKGEGTVLTFKVKVGADDVSTKKAITSMVKATDDLTTKAWELDATVAIDGETVKVTPPTGKTQAFVKVVIPADAPAAE